jgi:hypothetical protein
MRNVEFSKISLCPTDFFHSIEIEDGLSSFSSSHLFSFSIMNCSFSLFLSMSWRDTFVAVTVRTITIYSVMVAQNI